MSGPPQPSVHTPRSLAGLPALGKEFSFHTSSVTSCRSDFDQVSMCPEGNKKKKRILLTHTFSGRWGPHLHGQNSSTICPGGGSAGLGAPQGHPAQLREPEDCSLRPPTWPKPHDLGLRPPDIRRQGSPHAQALKSLCANQSTLERKPL